MIKLLNQIPASDGCGWGVAGANIAKHLPEFCELVTLPESCDAVLTPLNNEKFEYVPGMDTAIYRARELRKPIIGYGFHEFDIHGRNQIHYLPQNYTALACGSTWMALWVQNALQGVADDFPVKAVFQGVDREIFNYKKVDRPDNFKDRFIIASVGKFEFRKAQDVVIESFRLFKKQVPEAMLLLNWDSPWVSTMRDMQQSPYKHNVEIVSDGQCGFVTGVDPKLIAKEDQITFRPYDAEMKPIFGMVPNFSMAELYRFADVALFPNRVEAGQSLTACEAVYCGVPSILMDEHGMRDLCDATHGTACTYLEGSKKKSNEVMTWSEACISEALSELRRLYKERPTEEERIQLSNAVPWTWRKTAKELVALCEQVAV